MLKFPKAAKIPKASFQCKSASFCASLLARLTNLGKDHDYAPMQLLLHGRPLCAHLTLVPPPDCTVPFWAVAVCSAERGLDIRAALAERVDAQANLWRYTACLFPGPQ